jgi:23S rRNA pseudouridine1911/1915/1917 synthase
MAHTSQAFTVKENEAGVRLDQYLIHLFPEKTRSYFSKLIKNENVLLNGNRSKPGYSLKPADAVSITFPQEQSVLTPVKMDIHIVYEDDEILVVDKPAGIAVHPGKGTDGYTLVNGLLHHTERLSRGSENYRPGIVHRLDKNTSGLLAVAKTDKAFLHLRKQFDQKTIKRVYHALVWGKVKKEGSLTTFINRSRRDPTKMAVSTTGKEAITHYKILKDFQFVTLLKVQLDTGRTHQIRVHMNHIHHQVVGDPEYYGREEQLKRLPPNLQKRGAHLIKILKRQALHAKKLSFLHPATNELVCFESDTPADMREALDKIEQIFLLPKPE